MTKTNQMKCDIRDALNTILPSYPYEAPVEQAYPYIEFEWDMDGTRQIEGTVASISRVGEERADKNTDAAYNAYVNFTPDETVRLDMSVNVYTQDAEEEADDGADPESPVEP